MDEVSKEQALAKEHASLQQDQAAKTQVAKEIEKDHRVTQTPQDDETQAVKDDQSEREKESRKRERRSDDASSEDSSGREVVTDPDIGRHVDLTG